MLHRLLAVAAGWPTWLQVSVPGCLSYTGSLLIVLRPCNFTSNTKTVLGGSKACGSYA
jgi:hypothetical protein